MRPSLTPARAVLVSVLSVAPAADVFERRPGWVTLPKLGGLENVFLESDPRSGASLDGRLAPLMALSPFRTSRPHPLLWVHLRLDLFIVLPEIALVVSLGFRIDFCRPLRAQDVDNCSRRWSANEARTRELRDLVFEPEMPVEFMAMLFVYGSVGPEEPALPGRPGAAEKQSQVKGVTWFKKSKKWQAKSGKTYLGLYETVEEAAAAIAHYEATGNKPAPTRVVAEKTSDHTGVQWDKAHNMWKASITVLGTRQCLGYYPDESEAARAVDAARAEHGEQTR